jgi:hypothetical protein
MWRLLGMDDVFESEVVGRLRALGQQSVPPAVRAAHVAAMAQSAAPDRRRLPKVRIAAVAVAVVLTLSTGLAVAHVNAGPLSAMGEHIAGVLGVDITDGKVTHGTDRYYGPECIPIAEGKGAVNRGQYLKWVRQNRPDQLDAAKASKCGMPLDAGADSDSHENEQENDGD